MIDDVHKRTIETDILLSFLRKLLMIRKDLKLIMTSINLKVEVFKYFFELNTEVDLKKNASTIISVDNQIRDVSIFYSLKPCRNLTVKAIETILRIHETQPLGDILVFLTEEDQVIQCCQHLRNCRPKCQKLFTNRFIVYPLYNKLHLKKQLKLFNYSQKKIRKIIVTTSISETNQNLPNVVYVIDSLYTKQSNYNPNSGVVHLQTQLISKSIAIQRKDKAGYVMNGKCFRLCKENDFEGQLLNEEVPEVNRIDLTPMILELKGLGIKNILQFSFITPPLNTLIGSGIERLECLKLLDVHGKLTSLGIQASILPLDPRLSVMLLTSSIKHNCCEEVLTIAAMLSIDEVFLKPKTKSQYMILEELKRQFIVLEGDLMTRLNVFHSFILNNCEQSWCENNMINYKKIKQAVKIRRHLRNFMKLLHLPILSCEGKTGLILKSIVCGFFMNVCQLRTDGTYCMIRTST